MLDPFALFQHLRKAQDDPNRWVLDEIERRRPGYKREQRLRVIGLLLICAVLLLALLLGWNVYL